MLQIAPAYLPSNLICVALLAAQGNNFTRMVQVYSFLYPADPLSQLYSGHCSCVNLDPKPLEISRHWEQVFSGQGRCYHSFILMRRKDAVRHFYSNRGILEKLNG